jgi:hypothetical protein
MSRSDATSENGVRADKEVAEVAHEVRAAPADRPSGSEGAFLTRLRQRKAGEGGMLSAKEILRFRDFDRR